jgi:hypothetical protein
MILNRCKYALVLPWAVTIAVKFGVNLSLGATNRLSITTQTDFNYVSCRVQIKYGIAYLEMNENLLRM